MTHPYFYAMLYATGYAILLLSGRDAFLSDFVWGIWGLMKDFSSNVFMAGTGEHQPDVHIGLTVLLPSFIGLAWYLMEKLTGIRGRLERLGYIE